MKLVVMARNYQFFTMETEHDVWILLAIMTPTLVTKLILSLPFGFQFFTPPLDYWKIQDKTNNKIFNFVPLLIFPWKAQSVLYKKIGSTLKLLDLSSYNILTLIESPESFLISPLHRAAVLLEYSEKYTIMPSLNVISWLQCLWCSSYPSSTEDRTRRFASLFSQQHRWQTYPPQCPSTAATLLWPVWPSCQSSTQSSTTPSYLSQVKTRYSLLMSAQCNSHVWVFLINSGSSFINWQQESYQNLDWSKEEIISLFTFCENIYRLLVLFHLKPQPAWWFYAEQAWWLLLVICINYCLPCAWPLTRM